MVNPSLFSFWKISKISTEVRLSRFPVGSSAKQNRRTIHQSARDGDALLLSSGQLRREVQRAISQTDQLQRIHGPLGSFLFADLRIECRKLDILQRSCAREKIESLKDETNFPVAYGGEFLLAEFGNFGALEHVAAAGRLVQAAENIHERGLAAAAGSHDRDELAALDGDADSAQSMHASFTQIVILVDVLHANDLAAFS